MIIKSIRQNHKAFEDMIQQAKQASFNWPFSQGQEPVQPVEAEAEAAPGQPPGMPGQGEQPPPPPAPQDAPPPPKAMSGNTKNIADRILAEGLNLPEQAGSGEQPKGDPLLSGAVGKSQSRTLAKRKVNEANRPSSLGGMRL
jgi:hypothetical protein